MQQQLFLKSLIKHCNSHSDSLNIIWSISSHYMLSTVCNYNIKSQLHLQPEPAAAAAAVGTVWPPVSAIRKYNSRSLLHVHPKRWVETTPLTLLLTSRLPGILALTSDPRTRRISAQRLRPGVLYGDLLNFCHPPSQKVKHCPLGINDLSSPCPAKVCE